MHAAGRPEKPLHAVLHNEAQGGRPRSVHLQTHGGAHKGHISVESKVGKGSTFIVTLPINAAQKEVKGLE